MHKLCKSYYFCLFKLFKLNFRNLDCFIINNLLRDNNIFCFHHRIVFRTTTFLYKIIVNNNNAPLELKSLLKAQVINDNKYNLRSNRRTLVVPSRSKSK